MTYLIHFLSNFRVGRITQLGSLGVCPLEGLGNSVIQQRCVVSRGDVKMLQNVEDVGEDGAASRQWRGVNRVPSQKKAVRIVEHVTAKISLDNVPLF